MDKFTYRYKKIDSRIQSKRFMCLPTQQVDIIVDNKVCLNIHQSYHNQKSFGSLIVIFRYAASIPVYATNSDYHQPYLKQTSHLHNNIYLGNLLAEFCQNIGMCYNIMTDSQCVTSVILSLSFPSSSIFSRRRLKAIDRYQQLLGPDVERQLLPTCSGVETTSNKNVPPISQVHASTYTRQCLIVCTDEYVITNSTIDVLGLESV